MSFYRVTTPTHTFILPIDTSECSVIQVTYKQDCKSLVKKYADGVLPSGMMLDEDSVVISLTQEETKAFKVGSVEVQMRVLTNGGEAYASDIFTVGVTKVNNEEIL